MADNYRNLHALVAFYTRQNAAREGLDPHQLPQAIHIPDGSNRFECSARLQLQPAFDGKQQKMWMRVSGFYEDSIPVQQLFRLLSRGPPEREYISHLETKTRLCDYLANIWRDNPPMMVNWPTPGLTVTLFERLDLIGDFVGQNRLAAQISRLHSHWNLCTWTDSSGANCMSIDVDSLTHTR